MSSEKEAIMKHVLWLVVVVLLLSGCGPSGASSTVAVDRDVLMANEISTTEATNAYDAIALKRPWFLQSRGPRSLSQPEAGQTNEYPIVYVNRMYFGDLESLRHFSVREISVIQFLDSNEATMEFGAGHTGGVIMITTKSK
jgi:hypothetical protein